MTPLDLMDTFPEALPIIKKNLTMWRSYRKEVEPLYSELLDCLMVEVYYNGNEVERGVDFMKRHFYDQPVQEIDRHISRLNHLKNLYEMRGKTVPEGTVTDKDIEVAKNFPMTSFIELSRNGFMLCPFHADQHPSMKYYKDRNKGHCFVEGKSYDVIDVVQKINNCDFIKAVKIILGR